MRLHRSTPANVVPIARALTADQAAEAEAAARTAAEEAAVTERIKSVLDPRMLGISLPEWEQLLREARAMPSTDGALASISDVQFELVLASCRSRGDMSLAAILDEIEAVRTPAR